MAKNKKKQNNKPAEKPVKDQITEATITEVKNQEVIVEDLLLAAMQNDEIDLAELQNTIEDDEIQLTQSADECIRKIKNLIHVLDGTQRKYEEKKNEYIQKLKVLDDQQKELKAKQDNVENDAKILKEEAEAEIAKYKNELKEKREAINTRELSLIERETEVASGDHSGVVELLLTSFRSAESKVMSDTRKFLDGISEKNAEYLQKLQEMEAESSKLKIEKSRLEKMKLALELDREEIEEEIRSEYENKYEDQIKERDSLLTHTKIKLGKAEEDLRNSSSKLEKIYAAFGDINPESMTLMCSKLKYEVEILENQLDQRPTQEDIIGKQQSIDTLQQQLIELRKKFNEKEYFELQAMFTNNDSYIMEKHALESQLESAKAREKYLRDTLEDLRTTIKEINETHNKDNAFKTCSRYDKSDYQAQMTLKLYPSNLRELIAYLQQFMASASDESKRLYYSKDTIKKFIAGLYMTPISILQGISGTGKTSLPKAIASALTSGDDRYNSENGDDELPNAAYRICPIQSGWRDKMDLLGYYNSFEKCYHETEFFNALYLANQPKYADTLFFIVLDEMNLSRPEHYFADFLSKLELSEDQRKIKIDNVPENICPTGIRGGTLSIPRNVRFIGTANHDETTLEFAPKTYDRSNVINMPRNHPDDSIPTTDVKYNITYSWLNEQFAMAEASNKEYYSKFAKFIKDDTLVELLADEGIGIGNRFEGQARRFISVFIAAGENREEDLAKAVDHLVTTRLLRTLQNNYDLDIDKLNTFIDNYKIIFEVHFDSEPSEAIELVVNECKRKNK